MSWKQVILLILFIGTTCFSYAEIKWPEGNTSSEGCACLLVYDNSGGEQWLLAFPLHPGLRNSVQLGNPGTTASSSYFIFNFGRVRGSGKINLKLGRSNIPTADTPYETPSVSYTTVSAPDGPVCALIVEKMRKTNRGWRVKDEAGNEYTTTFKTFRKERCQ